MKLAHVRGAAMLETALTIGFALLVILGAAQLTLISYSQAGADGAAFVAAHSVAANPSANGATAATSVYKQFAAANFTTPSPQPALLATVVTKTVGGFSIIPGLASSYTVKGADVENRRVNTSATPAPYSFTVTATLLNYCPETGNCFLPSNHFIYVAQGVGNGNGNGANGTFSEWRCHQKHYAGLNWPGTRPPNYNAIKGTNLDPKSNGDQGAIYAWDPPGSNHCS